MIPKNAILEALNFRHATKRFDPNKKISDEDFSLILEAARLSPSSFGLEPWNIIVLQNMEIREKLLPYTWGAQGQLPTASHFILLTAKTAQALTRDTRHMPHIFRDIHELAPEAVEKRFHRVETFFTDDFKLAQSDRAIWDWAGKQAYIALANMMTVAALRGIDSCPIEGFQAEPVEKLLRYEGIVDGTVNRLVAMAAFGYRADAPQPKKRRSLDEIVTWMPLQNDRAQAMGSWKQAHINGNIVDPDHNLS